MAQRIIYSNHVGAELDGLVRDMAPASIFVLVDSNTCNCALPLLREGCEAVAAAKVIMIPEGDSNKNAEQLQGIWKQLSDGGATRGSLLINLGGGMITDIGGFAAATFKRGMRFVNVPTTLLAAVDAAVGGKTGINFNGLKNEVGVFAEAEAVIISTLFFNSLPVQQLLSGYAEMIKHALLDDASTFAELMDYDIANSPADSDTLLAMVRKSVGVKQRIVAEDPKEAGLRKALNLGHTVAHAIESYALNKRHSPVPHGYAVAWGLVVDLILSHVHLGFPSSAMHALAGYVKNNYGFFDIECKDYDAMIELMRHDKKNSSPDAINFTLLRAIGDVQINFTADVEMVKAAFDIYRDFCS